MIFTITCVHGYNIDTKIPFVRKGAPNSYFGFSLAEHQITNAVEEIQENVLLVGSPTLDRVGDPQNLTGGLYKCSFSSSCIESCDIQLQAEGDLTTITGSRSDQWFGSTVRSSGKGGYVVVCAHRYTVNYSGVGRCMALFQSLTPNKPVTPCKEDALEHNGESYCQAGTSAGVNMDGTVIVGGPGSGDWTGGVYTLLTKRQLGVSSIYYSSPWREGDGLKNPPIDKNSYMGYSVTSGHYGSKDATQVLYVGGAPHANNTGQVVLFTQQTGGYLNYNYNQIISGDQEFSLFGFDLATTDLNGDGYDDLIVGSPLYYEKLKAGGAIYVYYGKEGGITSSSVPTKIAYLKKTEEECKIFNCAESRFGFAVAAAGDINLDNYQDLVVGAPYEGDGLGAVYLFHGSKEGIVDKYAQRISATDLSPAVRSFGHALSGKMDLDQNGYDDIAVGAYQSDTAFLLRTRPIIHLSANVTVSPQKLNLDNGPDCSLPSEPLKKFYCISLTLCVSFTAKPVKSFNTPQTIFYKIEVEKDMHKKRAVFVNVDPLYPAGDIKEDRVDLNQLEKKCKIEMIKLVDNFNDKLSDINFTVTYNISEKPYPDPAQCRSNGVPNINNYPVLVTGLDDATTLTTKVQFSKCGTNPDGTEKNCESNIQMTVDLPGLKSDADGTYIMSFGIDKEIVMDVQLNNRGDPAHQTVLLITKPEALSWSKLVVVDPPTNRPSTNFPNLTAVEISEIGNPFGNLNRSVNYRHYKLIFDPSKLTSEEQTFTFQIQVSTTSIEKTPEDDIKEIKVRVINKAEVALDSSAQPDGDVFYRGPVRGESSIKKESEIGPAINHTYTVTNYGPGTIDGATLRILWPSKLKTQYPEGKHLLYLMQPPMVMEGPAECPGYPEFVNVLDYQEDPSMIIRSKAPVYTVNDKVGPGYKVVDSGRKRRDVEQDTERKRREVELVTSTEDPPGRLRKGERKSKTIITLDCSEKADCIQMECRINRLDKNAQAKIVLRARLWESTLVQDYPTVGEVWIKSTGLVILDKDLNIEQDTTNDESSAITYTIPDLEAKVIEEIKWWIILVSVLAGIIVLIIFILILWKCGFFKRIRPDGYAPTYKGDLKKTKYEENEAAYT